MPPKFRKYESGHQKRLKRQKLDGLIESQRGSLNKFIIKEPQIPIENQNVDAENMVNNDVDIVIDNDNANNVGDVPIENDNIDDVPIVNDIIGDVPVVSDNVDDVPIVNNNVDDVPNDNHNVDDVPIENHDVGDENVNDIPTGNDNIDSHGMCYLHDINDPRVWDGLDSKLIDLLVKMGPKRDVTIVKGPKDRFSRRFTANLYTRVLSNGEKCDRDWLVYSKELDRVFCFCSKIFKKGFGRGQLTNEGFADWGHIGIRLKEHETSIDHVKNMATWYELRQRFKKNQTIDKTAQSLIEKEKDHWKKMLKRIIAIVKYLAKKNLAFRGSNGKLYQKGNGNFLGLIEMLAEFDPIIQEHVKRITNNDIHYHYLGHTIQNELICLLGSGIKNEIIKNVKQAKYFSVILDYTPDVSHQEQMSLILRYVDVSTNPISIEESFLGFLNVDDTTGQGIFDVLQNELKSLNLDIMDARGQGYDNGSNMKGKHQGVQKKFLDLNSRAFYTLCGCHSLNLALCDIATMSSKVRDFFGVIQRIYTIFAASTKKWKILKDNVKGLTPKSLSSTRWESRVESVKAIRFQISDFRKALRQIGDSDSDYKIKSEASSLAKNELGEFEFLIAIIIWYELLSAFNLVSKTLQSKDLLIDVAIQKIKGLITFFKGYRETGFTAALDSANELAIELGINPAFPQRREIQRKRHFDENSSTSSNAPQSAEESSRINYFIPIVDQAITSLNERFEQFKEYESMFGFLFTSQRLNSLDDMSLKSSCIKFENALKYDDDSDIDGNELFVELKLLREVLTTDIVGPIDILKFLKGLDCLPNANIAYRILLTIPVTVASAERSFSKLKQLKSYLRSTMLQERLNGLALIAIERDLLEKVQYEDLIDDFASKNATRMSLFK